MEQKEKMKREKKLVRKNYFMMIIFNKFIDNRLSNSHDKDERKKRKNEK